MGIKTDGSSRLTGKRIAFIGSGNMAEALLSGLLGSGLVAPRQVTASDISRERLRYVKKKYSLAVTTENTRAVEGSDVVFLAVKPQQVRAVLEEIRPALRSAPLVISIAAGITTRFIEKMLPAEIPVIRAMPNTPALVAAGAVALSRGRWAGKSHLGLAKKIFSTVGIVVDLPEARINAVTALSGSGPAYVFYLTEALEKAGISMGLGEAVARALARQTVFGAGKMLSALAAPAAELRRKVTSPGGTTAAAIEHLENRAFSSIVVEAVQRARARARELAQ